MTRFPFGPCAQACLVLACLAAATPAPAATVNISEVLYDAVGADDGKVFVELYGPAGTALGGLRLEGINGANGRVGPVIELLGSIPADGFFVVADVSGGVTEVPDADLLANFDFQNGPDSLRLVRADGSLIDALGYGSFGPGDVFAGEGAPAIDPPPGSSVARLFANVDSDANDADFAPLAAPTPGTGPLSVPEPPLAALLAVALIALTPYCRSSAGRARLPGRPALRARLGRLVDG